MIWEEGLRGQASPSVGAPLGSLTVGSSTRDLCWKVHSPGTLRDSWGRALEMEHFSLWALYEENLEGGSFTGDPEGYVEEGSCDGHLFPWKPRWGTWKGTHLPGTLRDG
jgi:hypothetical protein